MSLAVISLLGTFLVGAAGPGEVVMRVGDTAVTRADLEAAKRAVAGRLGAVRIDEPQLMRMAVDQVITNQMLATAARKARVMVPPGAVAREVASFRERYESQEAYEAALTEFGLDQVDLTRREEERLLVELFIAAQVAPLATPSEAEVNAYYDANTEEFKHPEQVKLRMMLFAVASDADQASEAAARARAEAAIRRLEEGEDFAALAREVSEEETTSEKGGELIWVRRGLLAPALETAAFALEVGEITGAIRTSHGYHVLKLDARRPPGIAPFEEVEARLEQFLKGRNTATLIKDLVKEMLADNPVEIVDPTLKELLSAPANAAEAP